MDSTPAEEDLKLVGFFGIFKHSLKSIFTSPKLFTKITLTLILPLAIIFLAHTHISNHFFSRIESSYIYIFYPSNYDTVTASVWLFFWLFKIIYFTFLALFSLLSTAAVVFTVACVYSHRDVTFRQLVTAVVPNVWKKLFITFVYIYFGLFVYNVLSDVVLYISKLLFGYTVIVLVIVLVIVIVLVLGLLYLTVVWQLASVVTILEDMRGFEALMKGKRLASGKKGVGMAIAFILHGFLFGITFVYETFVEFGDEVAGLAMIWRVMIAILCGLLVMKVCLLLIVISAVLYLVCKSYHREGVDKLSLSTFLGAYTAETVVLPKPAEEIQLGRAQPQVRPSVEMV